MTQIRRKAISFSHSSNMKFILQRWKNLLLIAILYFQTVCCDYMPWSFFSDNGTLDNIKIIWKDSCPHCPSIGLEIVFEQNQQSVIDYVCLVSKGVCLYTGYFLNHQAILHLMQKKGFI